MYSQTCILFVCGPSCWGFWSKSISLDVLRGPKEILCRMIGEDTKKEKHHTNLLEPSFKVGVRNRVSISIIIVVEAVHQHWLTAHFTAMVTGWSCWCWCWWAIVIVVGGHAAVRAISQAVVVASLLLLERMISALVTLFSFRQTRDMHRKSLLTLQYVTIHFSQGQSLQC